MCRSTFSRRARSLATYYIFARVRILPEGFCDIGNEVSYITKKPIQEYRQSREKIYMKGIMPEYLVGHPDNCTEQISYMAAGVLLFMYITIIEKYGENVTVCLRNIE